MIKKCFVFTLIWMLTVDPTFSAAHSELSSNFAEPKTDYTEPKTNATIPVKINKLPKPPKLTAINTQLIEQMIRTKGIFDEKAGVFKIYFPRNDLDIQVAGSRLTASMGLTGWIAFKPNGKDLSMQGEIALHENQVNTVMSTALQNGLKVTALHGHFLWDTPKVMFMRIEGSGDEQKLSMALSKMLVRLRENYRNTNSPKINTWKTNLKTETIDNILEQGGAFENKVYKVNFGSKNDLFKKESAQYFETESWAVFSGTNKMASVIGEFVVLESELQATLIALRNANIKIASIHTPVHEQQTPPIVFLHYWGTGPIESLATGVRNALDNIKFRKP